MRTLIALLLLALPVLSVPAPPARAACIAVGTNCEDFTAPEWIKVDPNGNGSFIEQAGYRSRITGTWPNYTYAGDEHYRYRDFGDNFIPATAHYTIHFTGYVQASSKSTAHTLFELLGGTTVSGTTDSPGVKLDTMHTTSSYQFRYYKNGVNISFYLGAVNTYYYFTAYRDATGEGVRLYSDAARTNLLKDFNTTASGNAYRFALVQSRSTSFYSNPSYYAYVTDFVEDLEFISPPPPAQNTAPVWTPAAGIDPATTQVYTTALNLGIRPGRSYDSFVTELRIFRVAEGTGGTANGLCDTETPWADDPSPIIVTSNPDTVATVLDSGLTQNQLYCYAARIYDQPGLDDGNTNLTGLTPAAPVVNQPIPWAGGVPSGVGATNIGTHQFDVGWSNTATGGTGPTQYYVWVNPDGEYLNFDTATGSERFGPFSASPATITGRTPGTPYTVAVQACDSAPTPVCNTTLDAARTDWATVTTQRLAPANFYLTSATATAVNLAWDTTDAGADHYELYRCGDGITDAFDCDYLTGTLQAGAASPLAVTGLTAGTFYAWALYYCTDPACLNRSVKAMIADSAHTPDTGAFVKVSQGLKLLAYTNEPATNYGVGTGTAHQGIPDGVQSMWQDVGTLSGYGQQFGTETWSRDRFPAFMHYSFAVGNCRSFYFNVQEALGEEIKSGYKAVGSGNPCGFTLYRVEPTGALTQIGALGSSGAVYGFRTTDSAILLQNGTVAYSKAGGLAYQGGHFVFANGYDTARVVFAGSATHNTVKISGAGLPIGGTCKIEEGYIGNPSSYNTATGCTGDPTYITLPNYPMAARYDDDQGVYANLTRFNMNGIIGGRSLNISAGDEWQYRQNETMTHGPMLRHVGPTEASFFARFRSDGAMQVGLRPLGSPAPASPCTGVERCYGGDPTHTGDDRTGNVRATDLAPATAYNWRVLHDGVPQSPADPAINLSFTTRPASPDPNETVSFGFGSCMSETGKPYRVLESLTGQGLDFWMHLGDVIYDIKPWWAHWGGNTGVRQVNHFRYKFGSAFQEPSYARFMGRFPGYLTPDNHDAGEVEHNNGWLGSTTVINAKTAWLEWAAGGGAAYAEPAWLQPGDAPYALYYRYRYGDVEVWHIDMDAFRTFSTDTDNAVAADYRSAFSASVVIGADGRTVSCPDNDCANVRDQSLVRLGDAPNQRWYQAQGDGTATGFMLKQVYQGTVGDFVSAYVVYDMKSVLGVFKNAPGNFSETYNPNYSKAPLHTDQYRWLMNTMAESDARVKVIASPKAMWNGINVGSWGKSQNHKSNAWGLTSVPGWDQEIGLILDFVRDNEATPSIGVTPGGDTHTGDLTCDTTTLSPTGKKWNWCSFQSSGFGPPGHPSNIDIHGKTVVARAHGEKQVGVVTYTPGSGVTFKVLNQWGEDLLNVPASAVLSSGAVGKGQPSLAYSHRPHAMQRNTAGGPGEYLVAYASGALQTGTHSARYSVISAGANSRVGTAEFPQYADLGLLVENSRSTPHIILPDSTGTIAYFGHDKSVFQYDFATGVKATTGTNATGKISDDQMLFQNAHGSGLCTVVWETVNTNSGNAKELRVTQNPSANCNTSLSNSNFNIQFSNMDGKGLTWDRTYTGIDTGNEIMLLWNGASDNLYAAPLTVVANGGSTLGTAVDLSAGTLNRTEIEAIRGTYGNDMPYYSIDSDGAGNAVAVWRHNGTIGGGTDRMMMATWNGTAWSAPFMAVDARVHEPQVAYRNGRWWIGYLHFDRKQIKLLRGAGAGLPTGAADFAPFDVNIPDPRTKQGMQLVRYNGDPANTRMAVIYQARESVNYNDDSGPVLLAEFPTEQGGIAHIYVVTY